MIPQIVDCVAGHLQVTMTVVSATDATAWNIGMSKSKPEAKFLYLWQERGRAKWMRRSRMPKKRGGKREDLDGLYVRSAWEANYCRYLNWLVELEEIMSWEYEPDTFWFDKIKRGTRSYMPDFKIFNNDGTVEYHEIKGWMNQKSRTKLKRMAKYYPDVKVIVIDSEAYRVLAKDAGGFIPNWE